MSYRDRPGRCSCTAKRKPASRRFQSENPTLRRRNANRSATVTRLSGRDHAACNKPDGKPYYGTYDGQKIFDEFTPEEIGIELFKFEHCFYDRKTEGIVSFKTAAEDADSFFVSGSKLREMLRAGELPPHEITRPEVAQILIEAMKAKAEAK